MLAAPAGWGKTTLLGQWAAHDGVRSRGCALSPRTTTSVPSFAGIIGRAVRGACRTGNIGRRGSCWSSMTPADAVVAGRARRARGPRLIFRPAITLAVASRAACPALPIARLRAQGEGHPSRAGRPRHGRRAERRASAACRTRTRRRRGAVVAHREKGGLGARRAVPRRYLKKRSGPRLSVATTLAGRRLRARRRRSAGCGARDRRLPPETGVLETAVRPEVG